MECLRRIDVASHYHPTSQVDVLWGQPIKLAQVASTSELLEIFFEIVPCHF